VTPKRRYLAGLAAVAALGALAIVLVSPDRRLELASGIGLGLLVQAPLGWLTIRSLGTPKFQAIWLLGMVIRLGAVAVAGLVLIPALRWQMTPALAGLVGTILVLLLVEVVTVARDSAGMQTR
jgi:heme A synthase